MLATSRSGLPANRDAESQERAERKKVLALAQARKVDVILVTELTGSAKFAARSLTCFKFRFVSSPQQLPSSLLSRRFRSNICTRTSKVGCGTCFRWPPSALAERNRNAPDCIR